MQRKAITAKRKGNPTERERDRMESGETNDPDALHDRLVLGETKGKR